MDRQEKIGLGLAVAGHVIMFGLLSVGFLATPNPVKLHQQPIDVSLVKDVALEQTAPAIAEPAPSLAPDQGEPEDAAPPEPAPEPQPAPRPVPQPAPPPPVAKPEPKPVPRPVAEPKPAPMPAPKAKPKPSKPAPAAKRPTTRPVAKPAPAAPAKISSPPAKPAAAASRPAKPSASKGSGSQADAKAARPRGSRLSDDIVKGLSDAPSRSKSDSPPAQRIGAQALANIGSAILRQVQPCANRQVNPGPGAQRIRVTINLKLNPDGSLKTRPIIVGHDGVDDENRRYVDRVDDLAVATFVGCSPLRGLPADLYGVPGGWSDFKLRYKLPG